jgi:hypothetical protein
MLLRFRDEAVKHLTSFSTGMPFQFVEHVHQFTLLLAAIDLFRMLTMTHIMVPEQIAADLHKKNQATNCCIMRGVYDV